MKTIEAYVVVIAKLGRDTDYVGAKVGAIVTDEYSGWLGSTFIVPGFTAFPTIEAARQFILLGNKLKLEGCKFEIVKLASVGSVEVVKA